jgi:hypothetical protein
MTEARKMKAISLWPPSRRNERASFQLIELHAVPAARAGLQDIELARIIQEEAERFYNLLSYLRATSLPFQRGPSSAAS